MVTQLHLFEPAVSYPASPGFKRNGPSQEAAEAVAARAAILRQRVQALFAGGQIWTADEAAAELHEDILSVRPRLSELVRAKVINDSGVRRINARSGKRATVWRAT